MNIMIGWWVWVHEHRLCNRWIKCGWSLTIHTSFSGTTWPMAVNFLYSRADEWIQLNKKNETNITFEHFHCTSKKPQLIMKWFVNFFISMKASSLLPWIRWIIGSDAVNIISKRISREIFQFCIRCTWFCWICRPHRWRRLRSNWWMRQRWCAYCEYCVNC